MFGKVISHQSAQIRLPLLAFHPNPAHPRGHAHALSESQFKMLVTLVLTTALRGGCRGSPQKTGSSCHRKPHTFVQLQGPGFVHYAHFPVQQTKYRILSRAPKTHTSSQARSSEPRAGPTWPGTCVDAGGCFQGLPSVLRLRCPLAPVDCSVQTPQGS